MERVWGHVIRGFLLVAGMGAAAGLVPGCVHDNSTIFVSHVLAPSLVTSGMTCTFTADPTQPSISFGVLDVGLSSVYSPEILVGNQLVPQADPNQPHTETSYVTIEGAVIRIVDASGNQLNTYTKPVATTIPPSSGTTPGYAAIQVTIIDSTTAGKLQPPAFGPTIPVVSYIRVFGHSLGGESVESNEFGFPVNICKGCLVDFSASDIQSTTIGNTVVTLPQPNCFGSQSGTTTSMMTSTASMSVPCQIGQDLPIPCAACLGKADVCAGTAGAFVAPILDAGGGG